MIPEGELNSLVELARARARLSPEKPAWIFLKDGTGDGTPLTYGELDVQARRVAGALARHVRPGDRVLLNHQPGLDYIASFFGCLYAGVIAVPVYPPRFNTKMERLDAIVDDVEPAAALTSKAVREALGPAIASHGGLARLTWLETDALDPEVGEPEPAAGIHRDTLAFLQYTSGSTSSPKGVMLSHGNLLHNLGVIGRAFRTAPDACSVSWLPPYHDMGLIGGILEPFFSGMTGILMSPYSFLMRPARWLQAISRYRAVFSGGPNFAFDLCVKRIPDRQLPELDLSSWDLAFCGAEPIRADTLEAFARRFAPCGFRKSSLYPCYGLAEATLMVTGAARGKGAATASVSADRLETEGRAEEAPAGERGSRTLVSSGTAWGNRVEIVDPLTGRSREDGSVGEIWVAGPSVAQGYWRKRPETQATFRARLAGDDSGAAFLRTGDLGFRRNGEIFVTGRIKDLVILRGRNFYPQDIERTVGEAHPALNVGACAVVSVDAVGQERLVIIQELSRAARDVRLDEIADAIRRGVFENHGVDAYAISLIKPNSIPMTSSGKIQRQLSRQLFLGGGLEELRRFMLWEST